MKKTAKKFLAILLATTFLMSFFAVGAFAYDDYYDDSYDDYTWYEITDNNIYYYLDGELNEAAVTGYEFDDEGNELIDANVTIPETIEYDGANYTVTGIDSYAFADCCALEEITLPSTITHIGDSAFASAPYLKKVIIPDDCYFTYFGTDVFAYSPAPLYFEEIASDGEIILGQNVLFSYIGDAETYTLPEEINIIADHAFFMAGVEEIVLHDAITEINSYSFANASSLKKINIPDSIEYIGEGAFSYCANLTELKLGDYIQSLGWHALEGTKIKEIYIGDSMYNIIGAFAGCNTLEKITISPNNSVYFMENDALYYDYSWTDEETGESYNNYALEYFLITSDNTSVNVKKNTSSIADYAFSNCKKIKEINISDSLYIGCNAFENCTFESFDFEMVTDVLEFAFRGCKSLKSADLSNVYYVGDSAFENCTALASVTFGDSLCAVGGRAFASTALETVDIGGNQTWIGESAFINCKNLKRVNFNSGVEYIGNYIFTGCPNLERVYISDTVEQIEDSAFDSCENTVFEVIKYSYGCDYAKEKGLNYEIVGKVPFFTRVAKWFRMIFEKLFGWMMF